jgi:hypothetical protein
VGRLYLANLRDALVYPVAGNNLGHFRHEPPYIGWPLTILLLAGVTILIRQALTYRNITAITVLFVPYLMLVAGIALTIPITGQRYLAVTPLLALVCGAGLVAMAGLIRPWLPAGARPLTPAIVLAAVAVVSFANLRWTMSENRQISAYGDYRTLMAWDIGWRAGDADGEVVWVGPPFVLANGFNNLHFLAPNLIQFEVLDPMVGPSDVPQLSPGTILVIVPERLHERCTVEAAYPDATVAEAYARDGTFLYLAIYTQSPDGWSVEDSPGGSTLALATESPCSKAVEPIAGSSSPDATHTRMWTFILIR